jgi:hypothetical protein
MGEIIDLVSRTASSDEHTNCVVLRPVWPPTTVKYDNNNCNK